jgi:SAM-dependent methyltransferase
MRGRLEEHRMDLKEVEVLGDQVADHWYYVAKSAAMLRFLNGIPVRRILDVGAGSGFFARHLLSSSAAEKAVCVDPGYADEHDETHEGKPICFRRTIGTSSADLVLMMDVLEHVEDDSGLLAQFMTLTPPGASLLITVPAFRWMWSEHDIFLGHRRRYTMREVEQLISRAGLVQLRSSYFFAFVFPLAAAARLGQKLSASRTGRPRSSLKRHTPAVNALLGWLCRGEMPLLGHNNLVGLSVFCLARKS